jgi:hypothetical protein
MRKLFLAASCLVMTLGVAHCGGDDSSTGGGTGGSAGSSSSSTGNTATTGSTTSSTSVSSGAAGSVGAGAGGAGGSTGTGGVGGGLLGSCPASQPADGSACPDDQPHACQFGSTFCACGRGQPWICLDLDGGFRFDGFSFDAGFSFDGFGFGRD